MAFPQPIFSKQHAKHSLSDKDERQRNYNTSVVEIREPADRGGWEDYDDQPTHDAKNRDPNFRFHTCIPYRQI
jgi:hypothetical protein